MRNKEMALAPSPSPLPNGERDLRIPLCLWPYLPKSPCAAYERSVFWLIRLLGERLFEVATECRDEFSDPQKRFATWRPGSPFSFCPLSFWGSKKKVDDFEQMSAVFANKNPSTQSGDFLLSYKPPVKLACTFESDAVY